jgi:inner membrane protein involved in colicin E2 resistance
MSRRVEFKSRLGLQTMGIDEVKLVHKAMYVGLVKDRSKMKSEITHKILNGWGLSRRNTSSAW